MQASPVLNPGFTLTRQDFSLCLWFTHPDFPNAVNSGNREVVAIGSSYSTSNILQIFFTPAAFIRANLFGNAFEHLGASYARTPGVWKHVCLTQLSATVHGPQSIHSRLYEGGFIGSYDAGQWNDFEGTSNIYFGGEHGKRATVTLPTHPRE